MKCSRLRKPARRNTLAFNQTQTGLLNPYSAPTGAGPYYALILLRDRRQAPEVELLNALAAISFCREDVAPRIRCDAVHSVKLTGLSPAIAKSSQNFECVALNHMDLHIGTVSYIKVSLLGVLRQCDVEYRSVTACILRDEQ